jgi:hypothetical protein
MIEDLYFIPILAEALKAPQVEEALRGAFERIRSLGQQTQYKQGLVQFEEFVHLVNDCRQQNRSSPPDEWRIESSMVELATNTFEGTGQERQAILDAISSRPDWKDLYDGLVAEIEQHQRAAAVTRVSLLQDGEPLGFMEVRGGSGRGTVSGVTPGSYSLQLDTGRVLWEGPLREEDLLWTKAFPGQPLSLAADTGEQRARPTQRLEIFSGEIILQVFAGPESGRVEIIVNPSATLK